MTMDDEERKKIIIDAESTVITFLDVIKKVQPDFEKGFKELQEINKETRLIKENLDTTVKQLESYEITLPKQFEQLSNSIASSQKQQETQILTIHQYLDEIKREIQKNQGLLNVRLESVELNTTQLSGNIETTINKFISLEKNLIKINTNILALDKRFGPKFETLDVKITAMDQKIKYFFIGVVILIITNAIISIIF